MNEIRGFFAGGGFAVPPLPEQERMVEAVLFASSGPLTAREIADRLPKGSDVAGAIAALKQRYEGRGVQLARVGDAWAFRTAADLGFLMSREAVETRKLSRAALETLAIVAYHQPVTRAEIEERARSCYPRLSPELLEEAVTLVCDMQRQPSAATQAAAAASHAANSED